MLGNCGSAVSKFSPVSAAVRASISSVTGTPLCHPCSRKNCVRPVPGTHPFGASLRLSNFFPEKIVIRYFLRFAFLLRLKVPGLPSVATPLSRAMIHRIIVYFCFAPIAHPFGAHYSAPQFASLAPPTDTSVYRFSLLKKL